MVCILVASLTTLVLVTAALGTFLPEDIFAKFDDALAVPYNDAVKSSLVFHADGVSDFQPLIVDEQRQQIIVGARDALFRLNAHNLEKLERLDWPSERTKIDLCLMKGQSSNDCHNFIRTLAVHNDKLLICGTNSFSPDCMWRRADELTFALQENFSGIGYAPFDPKYNATYVMTASGQLYTGLVTDFSGSDPSIFRILPQTPILRTAKANSRWLNEPNFVAAFEHGAFVYVFFREQAVECSNCEKTLYSRVARICKNDVGGDIILQDYWTTFSKVRLNCSVAGPFPFYYDSLQSVYFDEARATIYTVFTTPEPSIPGSAVCVYKLADILQAFSGSYFYQASHDLIWVRQPNLLPSFNCEVQGTGSQRPAQTQRSLVHAQQFQLLADAAQPISLQPLHTADLEIYTHIVVDHVGIKNQGKVAVAFVTTHDGLLKKFSLFSDRDKPFSCLLEVIALAPPGKRLSVTDLKFYHTEGAVYMSTKTSVLKVSAQRCRRFDSRQACLDAQDPYCGWDTRSHSCAPAPGRMTAQPFWHQNIQGCPKIRAPVDGGFSQWSDWFSCPQESLNNGENCLCRTRSCTSPAPKLGGKPCVGPNITVSNCTRHGGWTDFSEWSSCSATCSFAVKSRRRMCTNPAPAHGGRQCLGPDVEQEFCEVPRCPEPKQSPIHGAWSMWESWSSCTADCGGGYQHRARTCTNPTPANEGMNCTGNSVEYRECNSHGCDEVRRWTPWTPWLQTNATHTGVLLKRYQYACMARIADATLLQISAPRTEEKHCNNSDQECTHHNVRVVDGGWDQWSAWSDCSQSCGNGSQTRFRSCANPSPSGGGADCKGHGVELRSCNIFSCQAQWSCWSELSPCSGACGQGVQHRVRHCEKRDGMEPCPGAKVETIACTSVECSGVKDGFAEWTKWSECNEFDVKLRVRACVSVDLCNGVPRWEMRRCVASDKPDNNNLRQDSGGTFASTASNDGYYARAEFWGVLIAAFALGVVLCIIVAICAVRSNSNCLYWLRPKPHHLPPPPRHSPPTPTPVKSNIYTPPPSLRNIHPVMTNITLNPLQNFRSTGGSAGDESDFDGLSEQESTLTLKRTMRTSLNNRDYL